MADERRADETRGLPEGLRAAIERTLDATAGSAAMTRERAQELLDEVARRGQEARQELTTRMRPARARDLGDLERRLAALERRLSALERSAAAAAHPKPRPEG